MRHDLTIRLAGSLLLAASLLLTGCGGGNDSAVETDSETYISEELRGAPEWVIKGRGGDSDKIYGLGSFTGSHDVGLARDTALARARNDIVLRIQAEVRSLLESYQASTTGGSDYGGEVNSEQHVENMVAQVAKMDLSGAGMEEMWISETNTMWVLAAVDIEEFSAKVNQMSQLNEQVRQDIVERAREGQGRLWEKTGD
jgi:hypothetical protein